MDGYKKPWHVMPTKVIELGLQHSKRSSDFDRQVAFLLLDIGVETALKVFLMNKKDDDIEFIRFPDLLKRVKDNLDKMNIQEIDLDQVKYFHGLRNKLYHQGDGVTPTQENLEKYGELAKVLLKVLLDVDINKSQQQELIQTNHSPFSLARIQKNIISLQSNSSLLVEHLHPQVATRKIEAQLRYIRIDTGPDDESYPPLVRAEFRQQRIDAFNKITGLEFTYDEDDMDDHEFVEYIIDNPEQLHVWIAFQEISSDDWGKYQEAVYFIEHEQVGDNKTEDKRYEEIYKWTHEKASVISKWVKDHISDAEPKEPDFYGEALVDLFKDLFK